MADAAEDPRDGAAGASSLREAAVRTLRALREAGHTAYFAGGCVRDRLLGLEPKDYDIATDATPEQIRSVFPRAHAVGEAFGVMLVRAGAVRGTGAADGAGQRNGGGRMIEVATFRREGPYLDGRRPSSVTFSDAEHDAQRRDFTINGLFEDPLAGEIIDYVGGRADLEAGIIRAIGDPEARLHEDYLRMLRAVRFAAAFGFSIEPATSEAIRAGAGDLRGISRERIGGEVKRMLTHPNRAVAAWETQYHRLDAAVLDEAHVDHAPRRVGRLPEGASYAAALAAWALDRHVEIERDQAAAAEVAARWRAALVLSNEETGALAERLRMHAILRTAWSRLGVAAQKRLASRPGFAEAVTLVGAVDAEAYVRICRRVADLSESGLAPAPLLTGGDLIEAGLKPGPGFGRILETVYDAQLEGLVADQAAALRLARSLAEGAQGADAAEDG